MSDDCYFSYGGVDANIDIDLLHRAKQELYEHISGAEELEESRDGIPFCGCSDCYDRVVSGFWISRTISWMKEGLIG